MRPNGRRAFVRNSCLLGFCFCGWRGSSALTAVDGAGQSGELKPESVHSKWITSLLLGLKDENAETARKIVKNRSEAHFNDLSLKEKFAPYVGRLEAFHSFLSKEWGWIIDYDREKGIVHVDENKSYCVCPLIQNKKIEGLGALCYCSEGIAEQMFSYVTGKSVKAEVVQSVLRGATSCKYRITLGVTSHPD